MVRFLKILMLLLALPLSSWAFFRFVYYPVELERHTRESYTLTALAAPTTFRGNVGALWFECTTVAFGSIHNYTQIRLELRKDGKLLDSVVLVSGEDLPEDHIPLRVQWATDAIIVSEAKRGTSRRFALRG